MAKFEVYCVCVCVWMSNKNKQHKWIQERVSESVAVIVSTMYYYMNIDSDISNRRQIHFNLFLFLLLLDLIKSKRCHGTHFFSNVIVVVYSFTSLYNTYNEIAGTVELKERCEFGYRITLVFIVCEYALSSLHLLFYSIMSNDTEHFHIFTFFLCMNLLW